MKDNTGKMSVVIGNIEYSICVYAKEAGQSYLEKKKRLILREIGNNVSKDLS